MRHRVHTYNLLLAVSPAATALPGRLGVAAAAAHLQAAGYTQRERVARRQQTAGLVSSGALGWQWLQTCSAIAMHGAVLTVMCAYVIAWALHGEPREVCSCVAGTPHCDFARSCRHEYPQWRAQDLSRVFPSLEESGLELLRAMLQYDPARRISVSLLCLFICSPHCVQALFVCFDQPGQHITQSLTQDAAVQEA